MKRIIITFLIAISIIYLIMWHGCRVDNQVTGNAEATMKSKILYFNVSHYCPCRKCCGRWADGRFASGKKVYYGGIAAPKKYKFGTKIKLEHPTLGTKIFTVEDRGKKVYGNRLDIFIPYSMGGHRKALELGRHDGRRTRSGYRRPPKIKGIIVKWVK